MTPHRITCDHLSVAVSEGKSVQRDLITDVSAVFTGGEVALVTGDTGAGKTTLLHAMACLRRPSAGQVLFGDDPVSRWAPAHRDRWRRRVGIVFQTGRFMEELSALENLMVALVPQRLTAADIATRCREALARLGLSELARTPVNRLSTGERQRVSIARALAHRPAVILADEPTAHQDDRQTARIMTLLAENARVHHAVVVVTAHDPRVPGDPAVTAAYRLCGGRLERRA